MPQKIPAWGARAPKGPLAPMSIGRRETGPRDVEFEVLYCGICHSDVHKVNDDWGGTQYPIVPGHEIVGRVVARGSDVTRFRDGDLVGVGCIVDSCRECPECRAGREMFCVKGATWTFDSPERNGKGRTYGGYSTRMVVDEHFVLRIPKGLDPAAAAPLLCAGITTYSPLRQFGCKAGDRVAVAGLGGLGHLAVKIAAAMGAEVTVLSTSREKENDATRLGARHFVAVREPGALDAHRGAFDLLLDTVSAPHDLNRELGLLRSRGTLVLVGLPPGDAALNVGALIHGNRRVAGSNIGGIPETQEMLDFCGAQNVMADVEVIPIQRVNEAYARILKSDVKYRFSIDLGSLRAGAKARP